MNIIQSSSKDDIKAIFNGINQFNFRHAKQVIEDQSCGDIEAIMKSEDGEVIGGALATLGYYGGVMVKVLWVKESSRGKGVGRKLIKDIESQAVKRGASTSFLDTFSFQAKDFYIKLNYEVYGTVNDFPEGHDWYYLKKIL
jgi:GNAT superfamily N-acetyltransferase